MSGFFSERERERERAKLQVVSGVWKPNLFIAVGLGAKLAMSSMAVLALNAEVKHLLFRAPILSCLCPLGMKAILMCTLFL